MGLVIECRKSRGVRQERVERRAIQKVLRIRTAGEGEPWRIDRGSGEPESGMWRKQESAALDNCELHQQRQVVAVNSVDRFQQGESFVAQQAARSISG